MTEGNNHRGVIRRTAHEVRRAWRRMNRRFTGSGLSAVYHDSYEQSLSMVKDTGGLKRPAVSI